MTDGEKESTIIDHHDLVEQMKDDIKFLEKKLGADNSVTIKMRSLADTMSSFTDEEIFTLEEALSDDKRYADEEEDDLDVGTD